MTTIHVQRVGDQAVLPHAEFQRLVELAQQREGVVVQVDEEDAPTLGLMRLAEQGGAFDFWLADAENVYSAAAGVSSGDVVPND